MTLATRFLRYPRAWLLQRRFGRHARRCPRCAVTVAFMGSPSSMCDRGRPLFLMFHDAWCSEPAETCGVREWQERVAAEPPRPEQQN